VDGNDDLAIAHLYVVSHDAQSFTTGYVHYNDLAVFAIGSKADGWHGMDRRHGNYEFAMHVTRLGRSKLKKPR
jgi:hypothetical protein